MFGPPGRAYVYLVYGMYHCLNVVTEAEDRPAAVLVRAIEPLEGLDAMRAARRQWRERTTPIPDARLAAGPGLVCAAFSITRADNGIDLLDPESDLRLEPKPDDEALALATGPRVGIDYAPEPWRSIPWRFYVPGNPSVSTTRTTTQRGTAR